mmetsp:Transcript_44798/g.43394  ORF Transcript_44798/g.43394 Transcript_44798/m.43394 type:complete len:140 (+) Transcript_44798:63-482(+)
MALQMFRDPFFGEWPLAQSNFDKEPVSLGALDVSETDTHHVIHADCPGLTNDEVKVQVKDGNLLTISGKRERKAEEHDEKRHYHRVERSYGQFSRALRLPEDADVTKIEAHVDNGELTISIPKGSTNPRLVDVPVGKKN